MAKKTAADKLFALEDDVRKAIEVETDDRVKAGLLAVLRAFSHLKDCIATSDNIRWPGPGGGDQPEARNLRGRG
jgi:hypothetical protein